ncbi:MAG TPA: NAD(P)-dependent oxidoreductase [Gemmatimonadales bacterium]|jgi:nucleoside-diphosphate-sugar epimerase|nr:NAD(P)-dependent oxidoreductase [Gemmatimonadales bacterium]
MARIFVTGANGFIGSHLIEYLLRRGDDVIGLIRAGSNVRSLAPLSTTYGNRLRLVAGDLRDAGALARALEDVEYVYHLGAVLMGTSARAFRETNVDGTRNLLEAVTRRGPAQLRRFLFASAQAAAGPSPDGHPIDESAPLHPVSAYGRSKAEAEGVVQEFSSRVPVTIVRPVAVYGEREQDISRGIFPMIKAGLAPRLGFRSKTASLIYVGDVVRGMVAAAESPDSVGKTYYLADPHPYPQNELVGAMANAMGKRLRIPVVVPHVMLTLVATFAEWGHHLNHKRPMLTRDKVRELKQRWWVVTPAAAVRDLHWSPQVGLRDGMARAVADWTHR